jgi:hypothetical protein
MDFISIWASAIAQFEGFNLPGSRPARNNNPGDLKFAGQSGATGQDSAGFAIFPDASTGFQALYNQLNKYVRDFPNSSLLEIMAHYLGQHAASIDSQGNAFQYAGFVAGQLGTGVDTTLGELASGSADVIAAQDGGATPPPDGNAGGLIGIVVVGGLLVWAATKLL